MGRIDDIENLEVNHFEYFFLLGETFEAIKQILLQLADSLDVGLSLLANGHLDPQG